MPLYRVGHLMHVPTGDGRYNSLLVGAIERTEWITRTRNTGTFWRPKYTEERFLRVYYYPPMEHYRSIIEYPEGPQTEYVQAWVRRFQ